MESQIIRISEVRENSLCHFESSDSRVGLFHDKVEQHFNEVISSYSYDDEFLF